MLLLVGRQASLRSGLLEWADRASARSLLLGLWVGLLTGLGELIYLWYRKYVLGTFIFQTRDILWLTPLVDALSFLGVGAGLAILIWLGVRLSFRLSLGILLFCAFTCLLLLYNPLQGFAVLVLALGLAMQCSRFLVQHEAGFLRGVRRSTPWLVFLVLGAGLGVGGRRLWHQQETRHTRARSGAPNVLLLVLDTVRAMSLSVYGASAATTPEMAQLAKGATRFAHPLSTAPWTLPSHASIFTGRWPHELSVGYYDALDGRWPTLAEVLGAAGYRTGGFVANKKYTGWETGLSRGFDRYEDYTLGLGEAIRSTSLGRALAGNRSVRALVGEYDLIGRKTAPDVNREFLEWLGVQDGAPFFAFLNYYDAHAPYLPPEPFASRFRTHGGQRVTEAYAQLVEWTPDRIAAERDAYDGSLAALDHAVGALLDSLDRLGRLENTIVIITADHGEEFGEHGVMRHGNSLYRPSLEVPLIVRFPGTVPGGRVIETPVSLRDIPQTIADLARIPDAPFPGRSLARYWRDSVALADTLFAEVAFAPRLHTSYPVSRGDIQSVLLDGLRYVRNGDGTEELYDFAADPMESRNLSAQRAPKAALPGLRRAVEPLITPARSRRRHDVEIAN